MLNSENIDHFSKLQDCVEQRASQVRFGWLLQLGILHFSDGCGMDETSFRKGRGGEDFRHEVDG